jgi:hypothetical protein
MGAVLLPGPSAGAAPAVESGLSAECADVVLQAAAAKADGVTAGATRACAAADTSPDTAAQSINATSCLSGTWTVTRTTACSIRKATVIVVTVPDGQIIGQLYYSVQDEAVADPKLNTWTHTISFFPNRTRSWGDISGTQVNGDATCSGSCSTLSGTITPRFILAPGPVITAVARFQTTVAAPNQVGSATTTWKHFFTNVKWLNLRTNAISTTVPNRVRCDNALGGSTSVGCVFPDRKPTLTVSQANGTYHRHVQLSLQYHLPNTLTRMQNPSLQQRNRDWACPRDPPRPEDYSCDEYPFASTWEGAYTGNHPFGRTFDGCQLDGWLQTRSSNDGGLGFSACMIVHYDNTNGGTELGQFYNNNRVLDGDKFIVAAQ